LKSQNAAVEVRISSETDEPRAQSLGQSSRRQDAEERPWVHAIAPSRGVAPIAIGGVDDRQRLERDLHDGVQNELVALIVKLAFAQQDPETPPGLTHTLAELESHAQAALDSVRNIAQGIYPTLLGDLGLREALRAQAMRVAIRMRLEGTAPRSTERAEEAVYFACSEAIQNVAKHAGCGAQVALRLDYLDGVLAVRMADDGRGFDPVRTPSGAGLRNIRARIEDVGGSSTVTSRPGRGTVLTISLPWPPRGDPER
jgi:signal transduction histidine kinase